MHSNSVMKTKSTQMLPLKFPEFSQKLQEPEILSPAQFRADAIAIMRTGIMSRRKLMKKGKGKLVMSQQIQSIMTMFDAYQNNWPVHGVARFVINHSREIQTIIPGSNPTLNQRFENILSIAPNYTQLQQ